ncbi:MAG: hypothetical protein OXI87_10980 [Albidovulum sp.]|nr:hypothetical protein [Albidovulum sp.]MDE0534619.1 hypothetical protein [Albidovulum sp.]
MIRLRKIKRLREKENQFLVELSDCRNRRAKAVHVEGTEYVKTFLPMSDD